MLAVHTFESMLFMSICTVWINENVIPGLVECNDGNLNDCGETYRGYSYVNDDENIGPLGDSVTMPQLTWSQRVTSVRDWMSKQIT